MPRFQRLLWLSALALGTPGCSFDADDPPEVSQKTLPSLVEPQGLTPEEYIDWYTRAIDLEEGHALVVDRELSGFIRGSAVHRYEHLYRGVRIATEGLGLIVRSGRVTGAAGTVTPHIEADVEPALSEVEAIRAAQSVADRSGVRLADDGHSCELWLGLGSGRVQPSLSYLCKLAGAAPLDDRVATVDAETGEVAAMRPDAFLNGCTADSCEVAAATAQTGWHGAQQVFVFRDTSSNTYYLDGPSVHVLDGESNTTTTYQDPPGGPMTLPDTSGVPYTSTTGIFDSSQKEGGAAYFAADQTLEFLSSQWPTFGLAEITIMSNLDGHDPVSERDGYGTAAYLAGADMILLGNHQKSPSSTPVSLSAFDTVAHEIGHKVASDYGLTKTWDPSILPSPDTFYDSLHESFADVFGELAEQHAFSAADWINGGDYVLGYYYYRWLTDPFNSDPPQPDVMNGLYYDASNYHINSSIPTLWFARLAGLVAGIGVNSNGTPYDVHPLGLERAFLMFARTLELTPGGGDDQHALVASKKAAAEFCGYGSQEVISVHNAWHSVNVAANKVTSSSYSNPAQNELDVHPWPARLSWAAHIGPVIESGWEVQVSPDSTFPSASTKSTVTFDTDYENNIDVGWAEFFLEPDTQYFWRVRPADADPLFDCWRPASSFTTGAAAPEAFYPSGGDVHPWVIPFSYSHAEGVTFYEIEVSETGNIVTDPNLPPEEQGRFDTVIFPPQIIPAVPGEPDQTARITVPKLTELVWHVRGIYEKDGEPTKYSGWSNVLNFQTNEPEVVPFSPPDYSHQYPWPVTLQWSMGPDELPGAEYSVFGDSISGAGIPPNALELDDNWLVWYHEAQNYWAAENRGFRWWVTAKGPPLGSEISPEPEESRQMGKPSPEWTVYIDADATEVQAQATPAPGCIPYGTEVQFQWPAVTGATSYWVRSPGILPNDAMITSDTSVSLFATPSTGSGFLPAIWSLTDGSSPARSDGLTPGVYPADFNYDVQPTKPTLAGIYPDPQDPRDLDYDWTSSYSHSYWQVEIYEGSSCSGDLVMGISEYFPPDSTGGTFYGATVYNFNEDAGVYSLRIAAKDEPGCPASPWSDCESFEAVGPFEITSLTTPIYTELNGPAVTSSYYYSGQPQFPITVTSTNSFCAVGLDCQYGEGTWSIVSPKDPLTIDWWCIGDGLPFEAETAMYKYNLQFVDDNGQAAKVVTQTGYCTDPNY